MGALEQIDIELEEARTALAMSTRALQTHGHQGISWGFFNLDAKRVRELEARREAAIAAAAVHLGAR